MASTGETASYDPQRYWDKLLMEHPDERGVAYPDFPAALNRAMYDALTKATGRLLDDHGISASRVLDIGSGTGIWVDFWLGRSASEVVGLDLTEAAVSALRRRHPDQEFHCADAGAVGLPATGPFDVVSAMSVLLHITDEERWRQAWRNIASVLMPRGYAVLIEPVLVHGWHGNPFDDGSTSKARTLADYRAALAGAGLELVELRPATVLLANPIDTRSRLTLRLLDACWRVLGRVVRGHEGRARMVGAGLSMADAALRPMLPNGPSAKLLLVRHATAK